MPPVVAQFWPILVIASGLTAITLAGLVLLRDGPPPYERRGGLLSPAQITFLRALELAVRSEWQIFSMVRLADIIKVRHRTRKSQLWQSRLGNKHIDFVLCDVETLEVKLTIELLDAAVPDREQTTRQRFLTSALSSAGLPLLRVHEETKYETAELRRLIDHALGITRKKKKW